MEVTSVRWLGYWDALLLAALDRAGCTVVLGEDMGNSARHGGVTVRNPFAGECIPDEINRLLS